MNNKQNMEYLVRGTGQPERVGINDSMWFDTLIKWRSQGHLSVRDLETGEDKPIDPAAYFGYDLRGMAGWFNTLPRKDYSEILDQTEDWKIMRDGAGAAFKTWKNKSGTPEHIDFKMTTRQIWEEEYRPFILETDHERLNLENVKRAYEFWKDKDVSLTCGDLFVWEMLRKSLGDMCMFESLLLDPGWIHDFNRVYTDFYKAHYRIIFEEIGIPDMAWIFEDLGYRNGLFCSPRLLEELIFPYYKEMVDFFHSFGLPVVFHSCGMIQEAIPLILETGFDGLNPLEVKAGNDMLKYAEKYGDRLIFFGGLDMRVLESKDKNLIRKEVARIVNGMKERGARYVFGSDHSVSTNVEFADYEYAVNVYRENRYY